MKYWEGYRQLIEAQVLDANHLQLANGIAILPGPKILIAMTLLENRNHERELWRQLSSQMSRL
jgi:hypothetical protein